MDRTAVSHGQAGSGSGKVRFADSAVFKVGAHSVRIRPVRLSDTQAIRDLIEHISAGSAYYRFGRYKLRDLNEHKLHELCDVDFVTRVHYVAQLHSEDGEGASLVGNVRYETDDTGMQAEFAIVVVDQWQGCGIGRQLMLAIESHAQLNQLQVLRARALPDNQRISALLGRLGYARLDTAEGEPVEFIKRLY